MNDVILSLAVLSAFVLLGGAWWLYRREGANRQSLLMAIMAFVLLANVLIWAAPMPGPEAETPGGSGGSAAPAAPGD